LDEAIDVSDSSVVTDLYWVVSEDSSEVGSCNGQKSSSINGSSHWRVRCDRRTDIENQSICADQTILCMSNAYLECAALCSSENCNESFGCVIDFNHVEVPNVAAVGGVGGVDGKIFFHNCVGEIGAKLHGDIRF
jgi:hypothetical protein